MRALIFDMDGLMIDSERLYIETEKNMAKEYGRIIEDSTICKMMGRTPLEAMKIFVRELDIPLSPEELLETRQRIIEERLKNDVSPMKGLYEIIEEFYGKLKLAISTGSPLKFVHIVLEKLGLHNIFEAVQTHEDIINGKPDPEIYIKTAEKLDVKINECIVLEDSHNGALAAKSAGCYCIAIPNEYTYDQDFSFVHFIAKDLIEAKEHIVSKVKRLHTL